MGNFSSTLRRAVAALLLVSGLDACASQVPAYAPPSPNPRLVQLDVFDRTDGTSLPVYAKDGRHYIVGAPGHEYALRIRNNTAARVLVVTSVDGVNVISGDTASPNQSGYVLDPWGTVEIMGWRKSLERTAAFFFTEHQNSYAARTGRPNNVGVIGVAVFREKVQQISPRDLGFDRRQAPAAAGARAPASSAQNLESPTAAPAARELDSAEQASRRDAYDESSRTLGRLGTGHGRNEASRVRVVSFERATVAPTETVAIQYDRRENLVTLGVLPAPTPYITRREPEPFPGAMRFAPDPNR